jgi:hypothetical protein
MNKIKRLPDTGGRFFAGMTFQTMENRECLIAYSPKFTLFYIV